LSIRKFVCVWIEKREVVGVKREEERGMIYRVNAERERERDKKGKTVFGWVSRKC
jgi:hypothetical protein